MEILSHLTYIDSAFLSKKAPMRPFDLHKGQAGQALLLAGSLTYPGVSFLTLSACLRSGVGYASIVSPSELIPSLAATLPSAIFLARKNLSTVAEQQAFSELLRKQSAVLIGSGRGIDKLSELELKLCLLNVRNLVIDADALSMLSTWQKEQYLPKLLEKRRLANLPSVILLPHYGELQRLFLALESNKRQSQFASIYATYKKQFGVALTEREIEHLAYLNVVGQAYSAYIVGKGAPTYIVDTDGIYRNTSACNALAKGGSGDILAGLLTGLLAQGIDRKLACQSAIYVHGLASDILAKSQAKRSILPSDLPSVFGQAFKEINWD